MRPNAANDAIETIIKRYTYDQDGRLDSMTYKLNDNAEFLVKHCEYDDLGGVAKNTLAYNGDISAYEWKGYKDGEWDTESYSYDYDNQNRLSSAYSLSQIGSQKAMSGQHDTHYEYDLMGNITNITRKGVNCDDEEEGYRDSSSDTQIADREYSNAAEYQYDANGNMTRNLNKGILKIKYNVLNLPEYIYMRNNQYLHNIYDGDGNKLSSEVYTCKYNITVPQSGEIQGDLDTLKITSQQVHSKLLTANYYYSGDFVYSSLNASSRKTSSKNIFDNWEGSNRLEGCFTLDRINFEEGYIVPGTAKNQVYDYVKDYLGNIRFVVMNGQVVETNNYYPFGGFYKEDDNSNSQRWKFGNKELDRTIDQYHWGFRVYDPTVGAFTTVDPMCELNYGMTPYSFANNNPANYTDLFGLKTYSWDDFVKHWRDFDVNKDDVELPNVYCIASKPDDQDEILGETSDGLGRLDSCAKFFQKINEKIGGSNLSKPLYEMNKYVKYNYSSLSKRFQLSRFHPSEVYKGINLLAELV